MSFIILIVRFHCNEELCPVQKLTNMNRANFKVIGIIVGMLLGGILGYFINHYPLAIALGGSIGIGVGSSLASKRR